MQPGKLHARPPWSGQELVFPDADRGHPAWSQFLRPPWSRQYCVRLTRGSVQLGCAHLNPPLWPTQYGVDPFAQCVQPGCLHGRPCVLQRSVLPNAMFGQPGCWQRNPPPCVPQKVVTPRVCAGCGQPGNWHRFPNPCLKHLLLLFASFVQPSGCSHFALPPWLRQNTICASLGQLGSAHFFLFRFLRGAAAMPSILHR